MKVVPCTRCRQWDPPAGRCGVYTGCEHLPVVPIAEIPTCPLQDRCQHEHQAAPDPCPVRIRGMVCESALRAGGDPDPEGNPLAFHADTVASPEEWAEHLAQGLTT